MHPLLEKYFSLIKRFLPKSSAANAVGLDIGAGECKLVEIVRSGDQFQVLRWEIAPIREGDVLRTIRALLENLSSPCKTLYTAVVGKGTLIRYIDMPKMTLQDMKSSFNVEADKYFPFAQEHIYTDCFILEEQDKGKTMAVMAAAAKKELIDPRVKLISELGLQANFIGINAIALANIVNVLGYDGEKDFKDKAVAILDLGDSVSSLMILINKVPRFTRDIFVGGRDLTKRISNALAISFEQAEALKNNPGERLEEIIKVTELAVVNIVKELRLSFDYFVTEKNCPIQKLLLTGGGALLEGLPAAFEKNLEISVSLWDPLASLVATTAKGGDNVQKKSLRMGVALGLALYGYD